MIFFLNGKCRRKTCFEKGLPGREMGVKPRFAARQHALVTNAL
jgi:hypothetical protein